MTNPHGDVVQLLDKTGKVTKTYDYDAFRNEINPDEKDENPIRYAGEYFDVETGTQYLRARYYAPELGRFITRDTYTGEDEDSLSLHLYTYCSNDPVGKVDPSGHNAIWLNSSSSAHGFGHAAVLIQNSSNKWDYLTYTDKGLTKKTLLYYFTFANKNSIINFINKNYRKGKKMEIYDGAIISMASLNQ